MTLPLEESYRAIHQGGLARRRAVEVVTVAGPDARSYLQGQCSQELESLTPGGAVDSLVLSPQGKLDAYVRVLCVAEDDFQLVVADGFGAALHERLRRFKLRVKVELGLGPESLVELRGPKAFAPAGVVAMPIDWPGYVGVDLLGLADPPPGIEEGDPEAFEAARIEAGLPEMGRELDEATIPPEAGIVGRTVSFTKGCYTGQELVARLDARGNRVARNLRGLLLEEGATGSAGEALYAGENEVGAITSIARSPGWGRPVALGYVRRAVEPGAFVQLGAPVETRRAEVVELPFLPS